MWDRFRKFMLMLIDMFLVNAAFIASLAIRFDGNIPEQYMQGYIDVALYFTVIFSLSYFAFGLYKKMWRYASIDELLAIVYAVTVGIVTSISLLYFLQTRLPRSIFILGWILNIVFIGSSRLGWRLFREKYFRKNVFRGGKPLLIVGAGDAGALLLRELKNGNGHGYNLVGFVDDDANKQNKELMGVPVLGKSSDIPDVVKDYNIEEVIIAMPSVPGSTVREIVKICRATGVKVSILPAIHSLMDGKVKLSEIREVQVEDLLRREPVKVDLGEISGYLKDKVVLVTGAGGSIGSELCRQIVRFSPESLILLGHDENPIFEIEQELKREFENIHIESVITNIREKQKVDYVFDMYRPDVVFHAAAHKHVPLMENNPEEAVKNNILGTKNTAEAADKIGCEKFILISTDKAVNPTSIMGATKRVAEMIIQGINEKSKTRFAAVRFGNVLGSRGSVLPIFKKQIEEGGPITITHPDMKRYFMTIPEAVQLVIQAGAMAAGGEIFILDMGEPVKIEDMARDLITLSGLEPDKDIEIVYTGIRPGEKLFEELLTAAEGASATKHKRIYVAKPLKININELNMQIQHLHKLSLNCKREEIFNVLKTIVPTYKNHNIKQQVG